MEKSKRQQKMRRLLQWIVTIALALCAWIQEAPVVRAENVAEQSQRLPADIVAVAADLEGKIGLLFFVDVPDYVLADERAYAELTLEGVTKKKLVSNAPIDERNGVVRRQFSYYADSTQLNSKVKFQLFTSDGTEVPLTRKKEPVEAGGYSYSVVDYCHLALDSLEEGPMTRLAGALIAYGEMAQIYFQHDAEGLTPDETILNAKDEKLADYVAKTYGEIPEGLNVGKPQGVYLILDAITTLRLNWKYLDGEDPYSYEYQIDGHPATIKYAEGAYCLEVKNVAASMLGVSHQFTISKGGKSYTWEGSALTWANLAVTNADEATKKMARALLLYNQAAGAYFTYVKAPEVTTDANLTITPNEVVSYDWGTNGELDVFWNAEGSGRILAEAYFLDDDPVFGMDQKDLATYVLLDGTAGLSHYKLSVTEMSKGRYLKVKLTAQDVNYEYNGATATVEFALRFSRHVAVLIANADYVGTKNDLIGPTKDIVAMTGMLSNLNQGWEINAYNDLSAPSVESVIADAFGDTLESDVCMIYYSGHGAGGKGWQSYEVGSIIGVDNTILTPVRFEKALSTNTRGKVIVLIDACYSGALIDSDNAKGQVDSGEAEAVKAAINEAILRAFEKRGETTKRYGELMVEDKYYVITSCGKDQESLDFREKGGLFSNRLIEGVGAAYPNGDVVSENAPADADLDARLTMEELVTYVSRRVEELRQEKWNEIMENYDEYLQKYQYYVSVNGESFLQEYPTADDWIRKTYLEDYSQVTSSYGDPDFVVFHR